LSKKTKLIERLKRKPTPRDFTWNEAVTVMESSGFRLVKSQGSGRMFVHDKTGLKVRLHEPHPQKTLLPYMVDALLDGLMEAGELIE